MSTRSGGPRTAEGKAVTRYNAATHGIYSVTPVLPKIERQAEWLAHRAGVFDDLKPDGYLQEIYAERIALITWRLRRLVRYEREQVRNRQRNIPTDLAISAMYDGRKLEKEPLDRDLDLIDRWAMDGLIPYEKELMLLMRYEGRLSRQLRLDMLHLEHMQRQRQEQRRVLIFEQPEPTPLALAPAEEPGSQPQRAFAERGENGPAVLPASRESLGDPVALPLRSKSAGERAEGRARSGQAPPRYGLKGNHRHPVPSSSNPPL